ncbi:MAG: hypothetical protein JO295_13920 [Verrucomicrobia bacterium]|nr:hypothetical protein [Verrucomicrobiota bacterium]
MQLDAPPEPTLSPAATPVPVAGSEESQIGQSQVASGSTDESTGDQSSDQPAEVGRPKKSSLTKVLPSERLTLARQVEVLRAFAVVSETNGGVPVTNADAGSVIPGKMSAATIVVTNPFFVDLGLLSRTETGFTVAPEVRAFNAAYDGLSPESAPEKLRPMFEKQWFMNLLTPRLRLAPMEREDVIKVLGEACNATKEHVSKLNLLIDFLDFVGCVRLEGNQVRIGTGAAPAGSAQPNAAGVRTTSETSKGQETDGDLEKHTLTLDPRTKRKINIECPPTITYAELTRIRNWLGYQLIITNAPPAPEEKPFEVIF